MSFAYCRHVVVSLLPRFGAECVPRGLRDTHTLCQALLLDAPDVLVDLKAEN